MKNRIKVMIGDTAMTVNTEYSKEKVTELAAEVTSRLDSIKKSSRSSSTLNAALLLLLELVDENKKLSTDYEALRQKTENMELDLEIQYMENERLAQKRSSSEGNEYR
ncbi:MAG: cell division protein ZapA [Clostridia bacterium]|nr:cell division protein ZapA [Clostridia bacterium]